MPHISSTSLTRVSFLVEQLQSLRAALSADEEKARKLQEENTKLKYRIKILLRSLDEAEKKSTNPTATSNSSSDSDGGSVGQHSVHDVKHVLDKLAA